MPLSSQTPQRLSQLEILSYTTILVLAVMYLGILHVLDGRAERYFQSLQNSNPELYLAQLRERRGFDAYLADYSRMEGFDSFKTEAPAFLTGRWSMRPQPVRMIPGTAPAECSNPVTFDYGLLLFRDSSGVSLPATYRISGDTVEIRNKTMGTLPVTLISYGSEIDHLEFVPPGKKDRVYAYRCGV